MTAASSAGRAERKARGRFYTPAGLVDRILTLALSLARERRGAQPLRVLDPACGDGAFTRRLLQHGVEAPSIYGVDIDEHALRLARAASPGGTFVAGDAIVDEPGLPGITPLRWHRTFPRVFGESGGFDLVVGNPPYRNLDAAMSGDDRASHAAFKRHVQRLRTDDPTRISWADHYRRMCDLYHLFMIRSLWALRPGGVLALLCSRTWLEAWYADHLRQHLLENATLVRIADFGDAELFRDTAVPVAVLWAIKEPAPAGHRVVVEVDGEERAVAQSSLGRAAWRFRARPVPHAVRLGDLCRASQGMQTGANAVFVVRPEQAQEAGLEPELLRRRAVGCDVLAGRLATSKERLALWSEEHTEATLPPRAAAWLGRHRSRLEQRAAFQRGDCEWFRWSWPRRSQMGTPKLICPYRARENRFWFDAEGLAVGLTDTTILLPRRECPVHPEELARVLNDPEHTARQLERGKRTGGGLVEYFASQLEELPISL